MAKVQHFIATRSGLSWGILLGVVSVLVYLQGSLLRSALGGS